MKVTSCLTKKQFMKDSFQIHVINDNENYVGFQNYDNCPRHCSECKKESVSYICFFSRKSATDRWVTAHWEERISNK